MVGMMAVGMGLQAAGSLFGGKKRDKAAKAAIREQDELQNEVRVNSDAGMVALRQDQARALQYRAQDEARLKAATGFDLSKLVADAEKAGFNPLTVLNATGGSGYDGRGAVLTSPFIGTAQGYFDKAAMIGGMAGSAAQTGAVRAQTAGYAGDALAGLGQNLFAQGQLGSQQNHEMQMQANAFRDAAAARSAIYGGTPPSGKNGSAPPLVGAITATGPAAAGFGALGDWWKSYGVVPVEDGKMTQQPYSQQYIDHNGNVGYGVNTDLMESTVNWAWVTAQLGAQQIFGLARDAFNSGFANTAKPGSVVPGGRMPTSRNPRGAGAW